jgi:hypothetical protein
MPCRLGATLTLCVFGGIVVRTAQFPSPEAAGQDRRGIGI